jgi:hypothetical protein
MSFRIYRLYERDIPPRLIRKGLTLEEAQAHCRSLEASSKTCTKATGKRRTKLLGRWFDSYEEAV